jgi:hypothetical protein
MPPLILLLLFNVVIIQVDDLSLKLDRNLILGETQTMTFMLYSKALCILYQGTELPSKPTNLPDRVSFVVWSIYNDY